MLCGVIKRLESFKILLWIRMERISPIERLTNETVLQRF